MENAVQKAIRLLGPTLFEASITLRIQQSTLFRWAQIGRVRDGRRAYQIAKATGFQVPLLELFGVVEGGAGPAATGVPGGGSDTSGACLPSDQVVESNCNLGALTRARFAPLAQVAA